MEDFLENYTASSQLSGYGNGTKACTCGNMGKPTTINVSNCICSNMISGQDIAAVQARML